MLVLFSRLIGLAIVIMGITYVISPKALLATLSFWQKGKRIYLAGCIRLAFGIILLVVSPQCRLPGLVILLSILFFIGAVAIFIIKRDKINDMLKWWHGAPPIVIRFMASIAIVVGILIIYAI